jgi:nitroreductase
VEFQEVVRHRHMVRQFSDEPVSPESLAIAIGHNAEPAPRDLRARRRPARDVIHYGRW